jgi:hypothetical protein
MGCAGSKGVGVEQRSAAVPATLAGTVSQQAAESVPWTRRRGDVLLAGQSLQVGDALVSRSERYTAVLQRDGDLVVCEHVGDGGGGSWQGSHPTGTQRVRRLFSTADCAGGYTRRTSTTWRATMEIDGSLTVCDKRASAKQRRASLGGLTDSRAAAGTAAASAPRQQQQQQQPRQHRGGDDGGGGGRALTTSTPGRRGSAPDSSSATAPTEQQPGTAVDSRAALRDELVFRSSAVSAYQTQQSKHWRLVMGDDGNLAIYLQDRLASTKSANGGAYGVQKWSTAAPEARGRAERITQSS